MSDSKDKSSVNDKTDEQFVALQQEIKTLYQQDLETPPKAMDKAILAQAKLSAAPVEQARASQGYSAATNVVQVSFWHKHRLGLSTAASVMIIASVILVNPNFTQHANIDAGDSVPMATKATETPISATVTPTTISATPTPMTATTVESAADVLPTVTTKVMPQQQRESMSAAQSQPQLQSQPESQPQAQLPTPAQTRSAVTVMSSANDINSANTTSAANATGAAKATNSINAIKHLAELLDNKQLEQAQAYSKVIELQFPEIIQQQHPQYQQYQQLQQRLSLQQSIQ
ncbi:hypothetical protein [Shewanella sp. 6_MG-2023]|uniref:hypothetical protein n=1 Tax=Shewanella sp. 6_MG-2023 TaxID=3062660 RepID=UPI0026E19D8D|nr:hypothetical protein [Shewanella sp. 6_MG-2023]MDO6619881.1 hypothetical protein [Shewanella sp. 6_MG-2023]